MSVLPQSFYNRKTLQVARDLLGCFLVATLSAPFLNKRRNRITWFKIVETEAYNGPNDLASHASQGMTGRNKIMFGPPGFIYVYFTYGMHYMFNIVTERDGYPAAVLVRAVEPTAQRIARNIQHKSLNIPQRTDGPARLTRTLGINKSFNNLPIFTKKHGLWISGRENNIKPLQIVKTARVGVDYAKEYKDKKWRFYLKDSNFVSKSREIKHA